MNNSDKYFGCLGALNRLHSMILCVFPWACYFKKDLHTPTPIELIAKHPDLFI